MFVTLADIDVDTIFASTSICDDIPSQECFVAAAEENQQCESNDAAGIDTEEQQALGKDLELYYHDRSPSLTKADLLTYVWSVFGSIS